MEISKNNVVDAISDAPDNVISCIHAQYRHCVFLYVSVERHIGCHGFFLICVYLKINFPI